MDSAQEGVVVGGGIVSVPEHIGRMLMTAFQQLPMKVVFRSNLISPDPAKILTSTWLPQNDLLGHPNTKVFVSHCGKNGQYEALYHAVPIVCTPLFGDQPYNAQCVRAKGFGEVVELRSVSWQELVSVVTRVAQTPSYKQAISKASRLFRQLYGVPSQQAAWWLDHVMQHGGHYMRYAGQKMPRAQFLSLDVLAFVLAVVMVVAVVLCLCFKGVYRRCIRRKTKVD
jgi:UDP:flavonoid glycosyltransferase YjiC (YdhE family)